jgi:hypothetical protein
MSTPTYDIYFRAEILAGQDEALVKARIGAMFKANEAKIAQLFSGKAIAIKKGVDKAAALKYQQAFKNAGAKAVITASPAPSAAPSPTPEAARSATTGISSAVSATAPSPKAEASAPTESNASESAPKSEGSWDVLPPGSDVLKPSERKVVEDANIDTSAIKLASVFAQVDEPPTPPPAPDTQHLSMAEAGSDMNPDRPEPAAPLEIDLSALDLAEAGARMSDESEEIAPLDLDLSTMSTAEPGSDLGQIKKDPPPAAPDTSHFSIDD